MFPQRGVRLGKVLGVEVVLDWSLLIIFFLITLGLGSSVFPSWHPDWAPLTTWLTAMSTAILFLASIFAHELSHALVARKFHLRVDRITLFLFGGIANVEVEPQRPKEEALMAGVGPVVSIALGFLFLFTAGALFRGQGIEPATDPVAWLSQLGPLETLLAWLGPANIVVGLFNLVPGYPLDGGRVLRAGLWAATGDMLKATRWASLAGRVFGGVLVFSGVLMMLGVTVPFLGTGLLPGIWMALIGMFLNAIAAASYRELVARRALEGVSVARLMRKHVPPPVPLDMPINQFVEERALGTGDLLFPVVDGRHVVGVLWLEDVKKAPRGQWADLTVEAVTRTDWQNLPHVRPGDDGASLARLFAKFTEDPIPVISGVHFVGCVVRADVTRWIELHSSEEGGSAGFRSWGERHAHGSPRS